MNIEYKNADGSIAPNKNATVASYSEKALNSIINKTNVQLDANDYTYIKTSGDENPNQAVNNNFEAYVDETAYENVIHIQVSGSVWDSIDIPRFPMNTLKMRLHKANVKTWQGAQKTIEYADYAINYISEKRAKYGAFQNRLEHTYANNCNTAENLTASESRLRDSDMAEEMVNHSKNSILGQVGQAMLAQSNKSAEMILQLLQ